jgi:hypothetical protein
MIEVLEVVWEALCDGEDESKGYEELLRVIVD